jgi:DNA repair photolyase
MVDMLPSRARKGRGAISNPDGRFEKERRVTTDDGWEQQGDENDGDLKPLATTLTPDSSRTIIARNQSPDIPFEQSINPYRGCEHGCVYCYARPSHGYLGLSSGLDFETKLFFKPDAARLLRAELKRDGYRPSAIALGSNTDPYQPVEKRLGVTRAILEVLAEHEHPFTIVTKSALVTRDLDIIAPMSAKRLCKVFVSITTLDRDLARKLEPRASIPSKRLKAIRELAAADVHVGVMTAPLIPALTDHEMEALLEAAASCGAVSAGYTVLRLPYEIKDLFREWLETHAPRRATHVLSRVMQIRDGKLNDPQFGSRMRGTGQDADMLRNRFRVATARLGLNRNDWSLDLSRFHVPGGRGAQLSFL